MKMTRLFTFLTTAVIAIFIVSCATIHPNEKLLVGTWKAQKVTPKFNYPETSEPRVNPEQPDNGLKNGVDKRSPQEMEQDKNRKYGPMMRAEQNSKMVIRADHTADKVYHNKTLSGTWKLNKSGTVLTAKSKEKGKFVLDIKTLTDSTMEVMEHVEDVDMLVKYVKEKK